MNTSLWKGLAIVVMTLLVLFRAGTGSAQPIIHVGDTWTYEGIAHLASGDAKFIETRRVTSVEYVEGKRWYLVQVTSTLQGEGTVRLWYTDQWSLARRETQNEGGSPYTRTSVYEPPLKLYSFPLNTGKEWWTSSNITTTTIDPSSPNRTRIGHDQQTFLIRVAGEENVQTSLGTFKAYVIEHRYRPAVPGAGTYLWYRYRFVESLGANVEEITYGPQGESSGIFKDLKLVSFSSGEIQTQTTTQISSSTTSLATSSITQTQTITQTSSATSVTTPTTFAAGFLYPFILVLVICLVLAVVLLAGLRRKNL